MANSNNQALIDNIGVGALFPIVLEPLSDSEFKKEVREGETKEVTFGWYPVYGNIDLIKQSLINLINYQIGQFMRNEEYGSRIMGLLEEPNTPVLAYAVQKYIEDSISSWEPRIEAVSVETTSNQETIYINMRYRVRSNTAVSELNIAYDVNY